MQTNHAAPVLSILLTGLLAASLTGCKGGSATGSSLPVAITPCQQTWRDYQQTHKTLMEKLSGSVNTNVEAESQKLQALSPALQSCAASGQISQADIDAIEQQSKEAAGKVQSQMQSMIEKAQKEAGEMNKDLKEARSETRQTESESQPAEAPADSEKQ